MKLLTALCALMFAFVSLPAQAMTIEKIVSPAGIEAWLVRESATPLVAMAYSFRGGWAQDTEDKSGLANLAASLLDEGAGDLDSKAYHERLENHAIEVSFRVGRDYFSGSLRTLTDTHSPAEWRVNGPIRNMREFRTAFGCKAGDPTVHPAAQQTDIW